jgi:hypothetical protein
MTVSQQKNEGFTMRKSLIVVLMILIVSLIAIFAMNIQRKKSDIVLTTNELGFTMKLTDERKETSTPYTWHAKVLISPATFSKDNLEKIFRWYSNRHPRGDGKIILTVFTDDKELEKEERFAGIPDDPDTKSDPPAPYNAIFFRDDPDKGGFYVYDIDPSKKDKQGSGTLPVQDK